MIKALFICPTDNSKLHLSNTTHFSELIYAPLPKKSAMTKTLHEIRKPYRIKDQLSALLNVGPMTRGDFRLLGIETVTQLAKQDADQLYLRLESLVGTQVDPCMHDVFTATIHQARTGEPLPWWHFTKARKVRQKNGTLPSTI
ncbi:MAG: helix-hairpin-helix domain-containing protein [Alphaproteobacteria bacterium]